MSDLAIETDALRKDYRRRVPAVDGLSLAVERGTVHGLLGPHGSGKTTTIRMLVGLARPSAGRVAILGEEVPRRIARVLPRIGATVGPPHFAPGLSGRRNLDLVARAAGLGAGAADDALARLGLTARGGDRYRRYPAAMRQRLALAAALLGRPEVLILDEPTQSLDPAGVRLVRELVRELAGDGVTVLLCSHVLSEVQHTCDTVTVLDHGRALSSGTVEDLVGRDRGDGVWVGVADQAGAVEALRAAGLRVSREGPQLYVEGASDPARVTRVLAEQGIYVRELVPDRPDLEGVVAGLGDPPPVPGASERPR